MVAERRAGEMANLLVSAITRDMRAAQTVVLTSLEAGQLALEPPYDVSDAAASAFARYPYPESFFASREDGPAFLFFHRAERRPAWAAGDTSASRFPVVVQAHPEVGATLARRIAADAGRGRRYSAFEVELGGVRYQVVARLFYADPLRQHLRGSFGFTVNMAWVRSHYFAELTRQVARIGAAEGLSLYVRDERGVRVAAFPSSANGPAAVRREFAMTFYDPLVVGRTAPRSWAVETGIAHDPTLAEAVRAGNRTLMMLAFATAALAVGLILTLRATRQSARLAELRSDFVSTVTHELKTPIASIRAIGDTLARGRITDPEARAEYAQMVVQESKRLARLVDNLLAYSRITDVTEAYTFEDIDVRSLLDEVLRAFQPQLQERQFDVGIIVEESLPPVRADRAALTLALDNLIDNAIRYSAEHRLIEVAARRDADRAVLEIRDHGIGIPEHELPRVTLRFHRAPGTPAGGSGLGLSIVKRVVSDHGGSMAIESRVNEGTTVRVALPIAEHAETDSRRRG